MRVYEEKHRLKMPYAGKRSVGLHISEVIRDLAFCTGVLDKKWAKAEGLPDVDEDQTLMIIGLAWEDHLAAHQHPEIEFHPGELSATSCECGHGSGDHIGGTCFHEDGDGELDCQCVDYAPLTIYMSPDGIRWEDAEDVLLSIGLDEASWILHEFKYTRKSMRDFIELLRINSPKVRMWRWQIMAYAWALRTLVAKLHVLFANGDYSFGEEGTPKYRVFRLHFTQAELDANWAMLLNHALDMRAQGKKAENAKDEGTETDQTTTPEHTTTPARTTTPRRRAA